jgi:hypothetical protein
LSVLKLPEPANWQASRRHLVWVALGVLAFTSFGLYWSVVATIRGHYLTPIALFGISVFPLVAVAALLLVSSGRTSLRAETDSDGTVLRPDRLFSTLMIVGFAFVVPSGLVFIFCAPTGRLDIPMSRGYQIFSPMVMALAVVAAVVGLVSVLRRGGIGYLKLTPEGIDIANIISTKYVDWDDVVDVKDNTDTKRRTRKAIVFCLQDGSEEIVDGADFYVPRGVGLYWMVRHYWRHPDDRAELTDDRALQRLRDERFAVD